MIISLSPTATSNEVVEIKQQKRRKDTPKKRIQDKRSPDVRIEKMYRAVLKCSLISSVSIRISSLDDFCIATATLIININMDYHLSQGLFIKNTGYL